MLNTKKISRKKSQQYISTKQTNENHSQPLKRKKSVSNLVVSSKIRKQDYQQQNNQRHLKQEKKLVHSLSKGKITKKHFKSECNDQNTNTLNRKKSSQKLHIIKSKIQLKPKYETQNLATQKEDKQKNIQTQFTLIKKKSQSKINTKKAINKKNYTSKQRQFDLQTLRKVQKKTIKAQAKKSICLKPQVSKAVLQKSKSKSKLIALKPKYKIKPKKLSQIIEKSILYSEVNFDFKQQLSFLSHSSINQKRPHIDQQIYYNQPRNQQSHERKLQIKAAIIIQKYFRGYIQRKYIEQAKYIIQAIKRIQRAWRDYRHRNIYKQRPKAQISTSLITLKDFNQTTKQKKLSLQTDQFDQKQTNKNSLQDIIKNLLNQDGLNQTIKQKIRNAMNLQVIQQIKKSSEDPSKKQIQTNLPKSQKSQEHHAENYETIELNHDLQRDFYVKRKMDMQISSQKNFNSPMNSSSHSLVSPGLKRLISPKCLNSSLTKQLHCINYFKSTKNSAPQFCSPKKCLTYTKYSQPIFSQQKSECQNLILIPAIMNPSIQKVKTLSKLENNSPIIQCQENSIQTINLLSDKKIQQMQTRRFTRNTIKPFCTGFTFVLEFYHCVLDYLRNDQDQREVFVQKLKQLRFIKLDRVLKDIANIQLQQFQDDNHHLNQILSKQNSQRPSLLTKSQRKIVLSDCAQLRLHLHENGYTDDQLYNQKSAQNSFIKLLMDMFQQAVYQNYKDISISNIYPVGNIEKDDFCYMNQIRLHSLTFISDSAKLLCGSLQQQECTQQQRYERMLINQQRQNQLENKFIYQCWDYSSCVMWINMLICKEIFQIIVEELLQEITLI